MTSANKSTISWLFPSQIEMLRDSQPGLSGSDGEGNSTLLKVNMKPDAIIRIRFMTTTEGGRQGPIVIGEKPYGCPLFVEGEAFDCRLLVTAKTLQLGDTYELPVKFLNPDLALPKLSRGKSVKLWEGKDIATGEVVRLV
jgi:hypothetical protein